jgi:hypothetical protein
MSTTMERLARNQSVFREINERIEQIAGPDGLIEFVCECSTPECLAHIELNASHYERVREHPTWFLVRTGHDIPGIERVVSQHNGYAVVEKLVERDFAREVDPRSEGSE